MDKKKPLILMILDGWGINPDSYGNAVFQAKTPCLDRLKKAYPITRLKCSGKDVGLPPGIMGNSEVGHLNIGAGRIVYQDLLRIDMAVENGSFFDNSAFITVMETVKKKGTSLHLMGLLSDGGVHSQLNHLLSLLNMTREHALENVYVHAILDGRDTPPDSGIGYVKTLQNHIRKNKHGKIASICGRYYAMDRDTRWERTLKAYNLYTIGEGNRFEDPLTAIQMSYDTGETDEFVKPATMTDKAGQPVAIIKDGDGVIFFNFRSDRARQITRALTFNDFSFFERKAFPSVCEYVCMTSYDETFTLPVAFQPVSLTGILGEVISRKGLRQLRIAETEKYAHVTYFFNGGEEKPFPLEDRCLVPSPRDVATYDLKPEMSALEVTKEVLTRIRSNTYDLIVLNFANMDMVGHTGVLKAAIKACEIVDGCVNGIVTEIMASGGVAMITADHGNSEKMLNENGEPFTAHTVNEVQLVLVDDRRKNMKLKPGKLGDIAPTILHLMKIEKPSEMTGESLVV
ncbi:MAG: 2,3-bisphosphoglycerate-independent phosphoglycerate mutase [Proteobacteria bacterium]|nr:2,3-bisphosphoglycerate-independent phosphoglycerate mutase [Pseudomonadota bacterium]